MSVTLTRRPNAECTLDAQTGAQVLARACASGTTIRLRRSDANVDVELVGKLVSGDERTVTIRFNPDARLKLTDVEYTADFTLASQRYVFKGRCTGGPGDPSSEVFMLIEPNTLASVERRRSRRRQLAPRGSINLATTDPVDPWRCAAAMLNVSLNGLACRVEKNHAARIRTGATLEIVFEVGSPPCTLDLRGRVVSVSDAGSPDCILVGIEFDEDNAYTAAHDSFAAALESEQGTGGSR